MDIVLTQFGSFLGKKGECFVVKRRDEKPVELAAGRTCRRRHVESSSVHTEVSSADVQSRDSILAPMTSRMLSDTVIASMCDGRRLDD